MSRILVTGMTASQTTEARNDIAANIARALRAAGHEVTVEKPSLEKVLAGQRWDHVFVGLGPLHGLGTSTMYGSLALIGTHLEDGKCTFFVDDQDTGKIGSGLRTMRNKPHNLVKPFYVYKQGWEVAKEPANAAWLQSIVLRILTMSADDAPHTLVPAFRFDTAFSIANKITGNLGPKAVSVDFSAYVPKAGTELESGNAPWWATGHKAVSRQVRDFMPTWPVHQCSTKEAGGAAGFLMKWPGWHPNFKHCADMKLPVVTDWRSHAPTFGEPYEVLAPTVEFMSLDERADLAHRQSEAFFKVVQSEDEIIARVQESMT